MKVALEEGSDPCWTAHLLKDADGKQVKKVIIETSYPLVLTQSDNLGDLPPVPEWALHKVYDVLDFADLEVYAEHVTIHGPISVPGKTVGIIARVLRTWQSEKGLPKICVDGKAGKAPPKALMQGQSAKDDKDNTKGKKAKGKNGKKGAGVHIHWTEPWDDDPVPGENGEGRGDTSHNVDLKLGYDPVMDGEPGSDGAEGENGGTIVLHASRFDLWDPLNVDSCFLFTLSACGGAGGKGEDGQPGADGGDAGEGDNYKKTTSIVTTPSPNGRAGDGGNGGLGGRGGKAGNGGTIDVRAVQTQRLLRPEGVAWVTRNPASGFDQHLVSRVVLKAEGGKGGNAGEAGSPGKGGNGAKGGKGTGGNESNMVLGTSRYAKICRAGFPESPNGANGSYGYGKDSRRDKPDPVPGDNGNPGTVTVINGPADATLETRAKVAAEVARLRRTSQLQMVLESVRARYLAAGFKPDDSIKTDLNYLAEALEAVRDGPVVDPADATQRAQKKIAGQLLNTVALLMRNLAAGCDVFGNAPQFVPMLSVATHQKALQDSLAVLKDNEQRYTNYTRALQETTDLAQQMKAAAQQAQGMKTYLEGRLRKLNQERKETQRTIDAFQEKIDGAKKKLKDELDNRTKEIDKQFGLSAGTVLNCLTQVAFLGMPLEKTMLQPAGVGAPASGIGFSGLHAMNSALLGATQLATALNEGLTSVLNDAGEPVKKEHILERLEAIQPSKFDDHLKARENGTYKVDDGRKLSVMREDLEQLCHQFRVKLKTESLTRAMNQYVDLIDERGRHQLKYNSQVAEEFELVSELRAATAREDQAQSAKAEAALKALPEMTALISSLYDRSRLHCLNELALANRALAFWKGEPCGNVADLIPGKLSTVNYQTLNNAWLSVQSEIIDHLDKAFSPLERFPAPPDEHVKRSEHSPFGVWIVLTSMEYPDQFADLQEGLAASFTLHPTVPLKSEPTFPFHGKADVRLSQVRVFFPGLPTDKLLTVKVTHSGDEYIQNPKKEIVEFRHNQQTVTFAHMPPKDGVWIDEKTGWVAAEALQAGGSEDGSLGLPADKTALPGCSYTPLGPFTTWTIELPPDDNPDLNLPLPGGTGEKPSTVRSKIERIVLDFHGFHHEFAHR